MILVKPSTEIISIMNDFTLRRYPKYNGQPQSIPAYSFLKDLTGYTFGSRTVLDYYGHFQSRDVWLCVCTCGRKSCIAGINLRSGVANSCGSHAKGSYNVKV